jgi:hypothetical protein
MSIRGTVSGFPVRSLLHRVPFIGSVARNQAPTFGPRAPGGLTGVRPVSLYCVKLRGVRAHRGCGSEGWRSPNSPRHFKSKRFVLQASPFLPRSAALSPQSFPLNTVPSPPPLRPLIIGYDGCGSLRHAYMTRMRSCTQKSAHSTQGDRKSRNTSSSCVKPRPARYN